MPTSYKLASVLLASLAASITFQVVISAQSTGTPVSQTGSANSGSAVERPPILGVAHIGLQTNDMGAAHKFFGEGFGFADFSLDKPGGGLMLTYFKVNDHQY